MSSFVVDKREFVKAAGLLYGIEAAKGVHAHKWFLDNVRAKFNECYEMNEKSVAEQYNEDCSFDDCKYDDVFRKYGQRGLEIGFGEDEISIVALRCKLWKFFRSVLYQIENEEMHSSVSAWFMECLTKLYENDIDGVDGWWGEIEL